MSEKELKLFEQMIGMLGEAGEGSFWLLLFWIGKGYFTTTLLVGVLITLLVVAYKVINKTITHNRFTAEARKEAGVCHWGEVTKGECDRVMELIAKGRKAEAEAEEIK